MLHTLLDTLLHIFTRGCFSVIVNKNAQNAQFFEGSKIVVSNEKKFANVKVCFKEH